VWFNDALVVFKQITQLTHYSHRGSAPVEDFESIFNAQLLSRIKLTVFLHLSIYYSKLYAAYDSLLYDINNKYLFRLNGQQKKIQKIK